MRSNSLSRAVVLAWAVLSIPGAAMASESRLVTTLARPLPRLLLRETAWGRHFAESVLGRSVRTDADMGALTRRLERAAALLRTTDRSVAEICFSVGLQSVGSFTTSFTRTYGVPPTAYRGRFPPASAHALIPTCVLRAFGRPQRSTFREDTQPARP